MLQNVAAYVLIEALQEELYKIYKIYQPFMWLWRGEGGGGFLYIIKCLKETKIAVLTVDPTQHKEFSHGTYIRWYPRNMCAREE